MPKVTATLPDGEVFVFPVAGDCPEPVTIGRSEECVFSIPSMSVSGMHALLVKGDDGYELKDAGSTNGLVVDGEKVDSVILKPGVDVFLGDVVLRCQDGDGAEKSVPKAPAPAPVEVDETDSPAPEAKGLHYDPDHDMDEEEDASQPIRVVAKSNIMVLLVYGGIIFLLAMLAGLVYQHYSRTGELLPYKWLGIESPKEIMEKKIDEQNKEATRNADSE